MLTVLHCSDLVAMFSDLYSSVLQAERFVMHELYKLERTAQDGYATYNFAKGKY